MKVKIAKMFSLMENYENSIATVVSKLPPFGDPRKTKPEEYFLISEIIEEIFKIDIQFSNKFEVIMNISLEEVKEKNFSAGNENKAVSDVIQKFKNLTVKSKINRDRAIIHLYGVKDPNFRSRNSSFTPDQKKQVKFAEETLKNYKKKSKNIFELYNTSLAKASKLYGTLNNAV